MQFKKAASPTVFALVVLLIASGALGGCRSAAEAEAEGKPKVRRQARSVDALPHISLALQADRSDVKSVQLYRAGSETNPPVLPLAGSDRPPSTDGAGADGLVLEFDLLGTRSEALSVVFLHRDRYWRDDGVDPIRLIRGFFRDEIVDMEHARATRAPYVHYRYHFPNQGVRFLVSGNYILRVTERFEPDRVLFERPFVVTEEQTELVFSVQPMLVPGRGMPFSQPIVRFQLPEDLSTSVMDFQTCFVRNADFALARCRPTPALIDLPIVHYHLDPGSSFAPGPHVHGLDLTRIQVGSQVHEIDFTSSPYRLTLEPDDLGLGPRWVGSPLFGQSVISAAAVDRVEADVAGEYVWVNFRVVPSERDGTPDGVSLTGSFSGWRSDEAVPMQWNAAEGFFEVEVLLKQGLYEYGYLVERDEPLLNTPRGVFNLDYRYTALVYFSDPFLALDRLIAQRTVEAR